MGVFYDPSPNYPDDGAARGVSILPDIDESLLLYEAGQNRGARIALLKLENESTGDQKDKQASK